MKKSLLTGLLIAAGSFLWAQKGESVFQAKEAERIISFLASDEMRGRKVFSPEIDKAADFIAAEFKAAGLQPMNNSFRQEFTIVRPKFISATASFDGTAIEQKSIIVITCAAQFKADQDAGYDKVMISAGANLQAEARKYARGNKNTLVVVDKSFANSFGNAVSK